MNKFYKLILIIQNSFFLNNLIKYKVAASVEHTGAFKYIRETGKIKTIVDIGANRGQFALIARYYFLEAFIFSFEPLPEPAEKFRKMFSNDKNIFLCNCAVGEVQETAEIHLSAHDDSSSLLPITEAQTRIFPGTEEAGRKQVKVTTLEAIMSAEEIESPALIKLDVQGFELNALCGCDTVLHCFDYVYCECSFVELYRGQALAYEVIAWLQKKNFVLTGIYNIYYAWNGQAVQADFLFTRGEDYK